MKERKKIKMTEFTVKVIAVVKKIPRGRVATYGQIARLAGKPHGARGVGWILSACSEQHELPWQRVLNSKGQISFSPRSSAFLDQKQRLLSEGIRFIDRRSLDLDKFQWKKRESKVRAKPGQPTLFS